MDMVVCLNASSLDRHGGLLDYFTPRWPGWFAGILVVPLNGLGNCGLLEGRRLYTVKSDTLNLVDISTSNCTSSWQVLE